MPRRFRDAEVRALHDRYLAGELLPAIAGSADCTSGTLRVSFKRLGLAYARYPARRASRRPQEIVEATRPKPYVEPPFRVRPHEHVWAEGACVVCDLPRVRLVP